jgi:tetratricopeptide (TPR) repeat protein
MRELGEAYRMVEIYKEAVTQFKRAIQAVPHYIQARAGLACTYSQMGRGNDAQAAASEVLKIDPEFSVQDYAGTLPYRERKDSDSLVEALRKAGLK